MKALILGFLFLSSLSLYSQEYKQNADLRKETQIFDEGLSRLVPAGLLALQKWKLQLPENTDHPGNPDEVKSHELSGYEHPDYFFLTKERDAVVFRAHCGGSTTKNSHYPRSELREMADGSVKKAAWSTESEELHALYAEIAITHTPLKKPHVVCAQIHNNKDDVLAIRLEGKHLLLKRDNLPKITLDAGYKLGTFFELDIFSGKGHIIVAYNGNKILNWKISEPTCYYKIGCYTQSNTQTGDDPSSFGETQIRSLNVGPTTRLSY